MSNFTKAQGAKIGIGFTGEFKGDVSGYTPTPAGYKAGTVDLAQGKTVTAGNASYGSATQAVDGNDNSYWGTYSTMPWWITIDLAEVKKSAGFYILQKNASYRGKDYSIQGSNDNTNWITIISGELENLEAQTIEYPASDFRYIKFNVTSYWSNSMMYVYTLKILEAVPAGNEMAFKITGKQYRYINGDLLDMEYKVKTVSLHPTIENALLLEFDTFDRFPTVEGKITVAYDAMKGNLTGRGGAVESFSVSFSPKDLIPEPNPGIQEYITVAPSVQITFITMEYVNAYADEHITVAPSVQIRFEEKGVINP